MKKTNFLAAIALALALAGCSSGVKLNDVPVETRAPGVTAAPGAGGAGPAAGGSAGPAAQSRVAPVAADSSAGVAPGPQGVGRVLYFDYDSVAIKPEFQNLIEAHARYLKANTSRRVTVEGHTDERGGREYNLALGQRRSEAVRRALGLLGVTDSQIEAVSFGKEKPAVQGADETALAQNRRAEIAYR